MNKAKSLFPQLVNSSSQTLILRLGYNGRLIKSPKVVLFQNNDLTIFLMSFEM